MPAIHPVQKTPQPLLVPIRPCRIIGIAEEDNFCPRIHRRQHGLIIKTVIRRQRDQAGFIAGKLRHPLIHGEGLVRRDDIVPFLAKRLDHEGNHFVRAIADKEGIRCMTEPFRQLLTQMPGIAAWVNGGLFRFQRLNGLDGFR